VFGAAMKHLWILNVKVNVFAARLAVHGYSSCETFIGICIGNAFAAREGQKSGKGDSSTGQWY